MLCALALVREALDPATDLVVLASTDSDLAPAVTEAISLKAAKIETVSWYDQDQRHRCQQLRPDGGQTVWNTRLGAAEFGRARDLTDYTAYGGH